MKLIKAEFLEKAINFQMVSDFRLIRNLLSPYFIIPGELDHYLISKIGYALFIINRLT